MRVLRRLFIRGLITLAPIIVVVAVFVWGYLFIESLPLIPDVSPSWLRVGLIATVFVLSTLSVGYLMRTKFGDWSERLLNVLVNQFPGIRVIYNAAKLGMTSLLLNEVDGSRVVRFGAWGGTYMYGIRTGNYGQSGGELVFIPGSPDISAGFVAEIHPNYFVEVEESVIAILIRLVSGGFSEAESSIVPTRITIEDLSMASTADGNSRQNR